MLKKILFFLIIFFLKLSNLNAIEYQKKIIQKFRSTENFSFNFEQIIGEKIDTGHCILMYPKKINCTYNDKFKTKLISNGKRLAIIQRQYKRILYYSLKSTPLYLILDKSAIEEVIKNHKPEKSNDSTLKYEIINNKKKINIFFDLKNFNIIGWNSTDIYENNIDFYISDINENINIDDKIFYIPKEEEVFN